jgi:hypothetical protein
MSLPQFNTCANNLTRLSTAHHPSSHAVRHSCKPHHHHHYCHHHHHYRHHHHHHHHHSSSTEQATKPAEKGKEGEKILVSKVSYGTIGGERARRPRKLRASEREKIPASLPSTNQPVGQRNRQYAPISLRKNANSSQANGKQL